MPAVPGNGNSVAAGTPRSADDVEFDAMRIRRATHADADRILEAHDAAVTHLCRLHYTEAELEPWRWSPRHNHLTALDTLDCFVSVDDDDAAHGFGFLDVPGCEVVAVYVHARAAGRGVGKALLRHMEDHARARGCRSLTLKASLNAVEFYFAAGYRPTGPARHRFRTGVEARCIAMTRPLVEGAEVLPEPPDMPIFLVPHDPLWARRFDEERRLLQGVLGDQALAIEHVGSTAIPGIDAKPLIDVLAAIPDIAAVPRFFEPLEALGYHYFPHDERRTPERRWFYKPNLAERTGHLHLVQAGSAWHRGCVAFRDRLRAHRDDRVRYEELKRALAARFPHDREAYTEGKAAFIAEIIGTALR